MDNRISDYRTGKTVSPYWANKVIALGFCAYDMLLYLDTHPDDAQALSYYNQCNELYNSAKKTYEERFEPLSAFGSQPLEDWDWNDGPMPWEGVK